MTVSEYRIKRAIQYAKDEILRRAPELADPELRKRLRIADKLLIIEMMLELAEYDYNKVEPLETL